MPPSCIDPKSHKERVFEHGRRASRLVGRSCITFDHGRVQRGGESFLEGFRFVVCRESIIVVEPIRRPFQKVRMEQVCMDGWRGGFT